MVAALRLGDDPDPLPKAISMSTDTARYRGRSLSVSRGLLACALLAGAPELSAQAGTPQDPPGSPVSGAGHRVVSGGTMYPGLITVINRFGPIGSEMRIATQQLPGNRDVQIMMGAVRDGFEIVRTDRTDDRGLIGGQETVTFPVPDWVRADRPYLVMITDLEYHPLAAADMFHVTTAEGLVTRRGVVKLENAGCPILVADGSDEWYVLLGNTIRLIAGEEMAVRGPVREPGED